MSRGYTLPKEYLLNPSAFVLKEYLAEKYPTEYITTETLEEGLKYVLYDNPGRELEEKIPGYSWVDQDGVEYSWRWSYYKGRRIPIEYTIKEERIYLGETLVAHEVLLPSQKIELPGHSTFLVIRSVVAKEIIDINKPINVFSIEDKKEYKSFLVLFVKLNDIPLYTF